MLQTAFDLALVILGFGLIVLIHELGHFLAARWAGIRVLAFAIGFGPPIATYRKGLGWRRRSGEREYFAALARGDRSMSPTEYRFNALPFGGYVKMLGQDDLDPTAKSEAPDSYQNCPVPRRMVVICAGVFANLVLAAALFIFVMMVGRTVEPPIVGAVAPSSPAADAIPAAGQVGKGLRPGDRILLIDDKAPRTFDDVALAVAMAKDGHALPLVVERRGLSQPVELNVVPRASPLSGLLDIGIDQPRSARIFKARNEKEREAFRAVAAQIGLAGVEPGMRLATVNARPVQAADELWVSLRASRGSPIPITFTDDAGKTVDITLDPVPELQSAMARTATGLVPVSHLFGLSGVMMVEKAEAAAAKQGLRDGDIFARLGDVEFPSVAQGVQQIRSRASSTIDIVVLRKDAAGNWSEVSLPAIRVSRKGQIGFGLGETSDKDNLLAAPIQSLVDVAGKTFTPAAASLNITPGSRLLAVSGAPVRTLGEARDALRAAALASSTGAFDVELKIRRFTSAGEPAPDETLIWRLPAPDVDALAALSWRTNLPPQLFELEHITLKARNPLQALSMGLSETNRVMLMTYLTFQRLAEGSVKVEHLKGPVGIAHLGTLVAGRGIIWLLFFLALISVNLAVINFRPLPIVDGGQFLFLLYEWLRGKPVPVGVQNGVTFAGLFLIGGLFLFVTYNDIRNLLGL